MTRRPSGMVSRHRKAPEGFRYSMATREELQDYMDSHNGRTPPRNVRHVTCRACGKRMWGSGIGIGAHRKACTAKEG